jgi:hypothetical protein
VQSCALDKAFFTTRYVFLHVYLPLSILSKVILALHNEEFDFRSKDIVHQISRAELNLDSRDKKACTGELTLETPMSNKLHDLAKDLEKAGQSKPQADVDNIPWNEIALEKRRPLRANFTAATSIVIPYYPYWSIFDREGDTFKSELTCFWNIANLLSATTGTVEFLEKAIERWETVDVPQGIGLQSKEERALEISKATQYTNSTPYRTSWEQWIQAGAPASRALEFLARNGLFNQMYDDQLKERRNKEFQKNQDKHKRSKSQGPNKQKEQGSHQASQKRARSKSQTGGNPLKQPNTSKEWNTREESSSSHDPRWNQGHSNWQQSWASDSYSYRGSRPDLNVSTQLQQYWQSYPVTSNPSWPTASSSSSGAPDSRNTQAHRRNDGSRGLAPPRSKQELPNDHFQ